MASTTSRPTAPLEVDDAIRIATANLELRFTEILPEIAAMLHREVPEIAAVRTPAQTVRVGAEIIGSFIETVRRGEPPAWTEHSELSVDIVRGLAQLEVSQRTLVRWIQLGQAAVMSQWETEFERLALDTRTRWATLAKADELAFAFVDGYTRAVFAEFADERQRLLASTELRRARTVRALLNATPANPDAVSRALGYELERQHTAMVLWTLGGERDATQRIQRAAEEIAHAVGGTAPLLVFSDASCGWAWIATHESDRGPAATLARTARRDRVSVAVGDPAGGPEGFRLSHQDAIAAMAVARHAGRRPGSIVFYRDVELSALAINDMDRTRAFVIDTLGRLARDDDESARLRATLRVFFDCEHSRRDTAHRLGVHPNTVGARIQTCEELLAARGSAPPLAELRAALVLSAQLGSAVLA